MLTSNNISNEPLKYSKVVVMLDEMKKSLKLEYLSDDRKYTDSVIISVKELLLKIDREKMSIKGDAYVSRFLRDNSSLEITSDILFLNMIQNLVYLTFNRYGVSVKNCLDLPENKVNTMMIENFSKCLISEVVKKESELSTILGKSNKLYTKGVFVPSKNFKLSISKLDRDMNSLKTQVSKMYLSSQHLIALVEKYYDITYKIKVLNKYLTNNLYKP